MSCNIIRQEKDGYHHKHSHLFCPLIDVLLRLGIARVRHIVQLVIYKSTFLGNLFTFDDFQPPDQVLRLYFRFTENQSMLQ